MNRQSMRRRVRLTGEATDFKSISRRHPWFFSGAFISDDLRVLTEGEVVDVVTRSGEMVGTGYYERGGGIAVRMLSYSPLSETGTDHHFFVTRLRKAYEVRQKLGLTGTEHGYRLIYGEGDSLPGLIIDVYAGVAVMQAHTVGMALLKETIATAIPEAVPDVKAVYYKSEGTLRPSLDPEGAIKAKRDTILYGSLPEGNSGTFLENGVRFQPDIVKGQKTGFFLDQRDNRQLLMHYSRGKRVLNMFCYTGGFSLLALKGGAKSVTSVDSSEQALSLLTHNLTLNPDLTGAHEAVAQDAFDFLTHMESEAYDIVVLDPPAFAKNRSSLTNALKGYRRLNTLALRKMAPGTLLFTFSCSQVVTPEYFQQAIFSAALSAQRDVRILHRLTQSADHPVSIYHPEGEYLKGLVLYVE